ncbi:hypothetical protein [Sporosarcina sp. FSL K6-2383]|uniref:hypothetical protein n=1 Tax=Sporosarcina sp. FSL K6-2383 TaxID=2921556 RepID=UPI00315A6D2D
MDIWVVPMIIVVLLICTIGLLSARKSRQANTSANGQDSAIPEIIENHPFTLNPIIWVIFIYAIFLFTVIFYYATSSS